MKKNLLVIDPSRGAAGDMLVSALVALAGEREAAAYLKERMAKAGFRQTVPFRKTARGHATCLLMSVKGPDEEFQPKAMKRKLASSAKRAGLSREARAFCASALSALVEGEKSAHGPKGAHFHELSSADTAIDIFCAAAMLEKINAFKNAEFRLLPAGVGSGAGQAALHVLKKAGIPVVFSSESRELCTPTASSLFSALSRLPQASAWREAKISSIGCGAGRENPKQSQNLLRAILSAPGEPEPGEGQLKGSAILIEANIDDMTGESLAFAASELMKAGADDACLVPAAMKKGRPGFILRVLCGEEGKEKLLEAIFSLTTTWGVRISPVEKRMLRRETFAAKTGLGTVRMKCGGGKCKPEFADIEKIARRKKIPLEEAAFRARAGAGDLNPGNERH